MKALIVEDEFINRVVLQEMLAPYGEVHVAVDGFEALSVFEAALKSDPYDLVCMDIMMPGMDGQACLVRMREMERERGVDPRNETKVIMVTALSDPKTVIESYYRCGASAFLAKPIDREELLSRLRELKLLAP
ncbi:MAG: response regulator [Desulfovibrionaceae bacterium]